MIVLAPGLRYLDLHFRQTPEGIATAVIDSPAGAALVDPGPGSCLDTLKSELAAGGLSVADLRTILLTHIHLDHAGVTGALVRENPSIQVFVHERGAPHVIDPSKLLISASRLFGADMAHYGDSLPVPEANVTTLKGGERITVAGRTLDVAYTPGHASHHVSYFDPASRVAFVGDTGGISQPRSPFSLPPTPPPEIDPDLWEQSAARIMAWRPDTLFLTHFGPAQSAPAVQLQDTLDRLRQHAAVAKDLLALDISDADRLARYIDYFRADLRRHVDEGLAQRYEFGMSPVHCWIGLSRYWTKRGVAAPASTSGSRAGS
jgi:glyoxylase-like metal-dependent hydrolase (beta-lactamase superfamily II)